MASKAIGDRDRSPTQLEVTASPWPLAPLNVFFKSAYVPGAFDLTWSDPSELAVNSSFQLLGVNIYRSFDSEFGPFERITDQPIGSGYWRDQTDNEIVLDEDVSGAFLVRGVAGGGQQGQRFIFRILKGPIVKEGSQAQPTRSPYDVTVYVDGVLARVARVLGESGEVELDARYYTDPTTQQQIVPVLPGPDSVVTCTYRRNRDLVRTDLQQKVFWRFTAVGVPTCMNPADASAEDLVETPLEYGTPTNSAEIEKLDYMWREAIRRNRWILGQGGETVKVFLRKNVGVPCLCWPDYHHHQPISDCPTCFGTGFVDGYEGPYDILIAPDDAERRISQKENGRSIEHSYEVWTGATPLLSMRDFLVKIDGDRYSIGAVRRPSNRGNILQQHFTIGHIDEKDIRTSVPVGNPIRGQASQFIPSGPEAASPAEPTDKPNIPKERQLRGRTKVWSNGSY